MVYYVTNKVNKLNYCVKFSIYFALKWDLVVNEKPISVG